MDDIVDSIQVFYRASRSSSISFISNDRAAMSLFAIQYVSCVSRMFGASKPFVRRRTKDSLSGQVFVWDSIKGSRHFSAASEPSNTRSKDMSSSVLSLYKRQDDRIALPRAALGLSALNTTYWLWYSLDFIPAVNASPMEDLHIDPKIGWGALGLGLAINALTALYPSLLISRMDYDASKKEILIYRYSLPLLSPSSSPTSYPLGEIVLDPSGPDVAKILGRYSGNLSRYKGHLALKRKNESFPLLLEVQHGHREVLNGEALLQAMLRPRAFGSHSSSTVSAKKGKKAKHPNARTR